MKTSLLKLGLFVLILVGGAVMSFAENQNVKVKGNFRGFDNAKILIYSADVNRLVGESVIHNGNFEVDVKADPSQAAKYFVYLPILDDGKQRGIDTRFFFIDNEVVQLSGRLKAGNVGRFKQVGSAVYDSFLSCDKNLDDTEFSVMKKSYAKTSDLFQACKNNLEKGKLQSEKYRLEGKLSSAEIKMYFDLTHQLEKGKVNLGLDAKIYEMFYPYRYSFIKPVIEKYEEVLGKEYFKQSYWAERLLKRYHVVSMYLEGRPVVDCEFLTMEGKYAKISDFKGKYVYIHLWDYDWDASSDQIENLKLMAEKFRKKNIVFINVCVNDDVERWKYMSKAMGSDHIVHLFHNKERETENYIQRDFTFKYAYKTKKMPRAILITPEQTIKKFRMSTPNGVMTMKTLKKLL